ncbi:MAG: hypothetical protein E7278_11855, partial [Lachnospiraceae bacterium]|nr:hypothetical protein [Lachnospiraceae bacterium]
DLIIPKGEPLALFSFMNLHHYMDITEMLCFFACRIATGCVDWLVMYVLVEKYRFNDLIIKAIANIIVIILNYLGGKLLVFQKDNVCSVFLKRQS